MRRAFRWRVFGCCLLLGLAGCARSWFEEREPWRHEAEISCLKSGAVKEGPSIAITTAIEGPGACGARRAGRRGAGGGGGGGGARPRPAGAGGGAGGRLPVSFGSPRLFLLA